MRRRLATRQSSLRKKKLPRKKIKRRPGTSKARMYFDMNTQAAILQYQQSEDRAEKEKLYVSTILPSFEKLVENLIFIYGFAKPSENYLTLKSDCVSFLYETIHKWDVTRGTKAFSYFNVVAKNWLIINSRRTQKRKRRHVSMSDITIMSKNDKASLARHDVIDAPDDIMIKMLFKDEIMVLLKEIKERLSGENELKCIDAVITVFETIQQLDFLNKRAVFVYIRDISGLSPKQLSVAMSQIRKHYRQLVHSGGEFDIF